jgi:hypothetical protein
VSRLFARLLSGHVIVTARKMGWDDLKNGALLASARKEGFHAFITVDKNMRYQQNTGELPLPVIAIQSVGNDVESLRPYAPDVLRLLSQRLERKVYVIPRRP